MKNRLVVPAIALLLCATACSTGAGATESAAPNADGSPKELRIGYQLSPNGDVVVKDQHWLEQALPHTKISWIKFDSGGDVNTAMVAGGIDIGLAGSSPVTSGLSAPLDIPYEVPWIYDVIGENEALVARGATSVAQLKGKKIATPFSSTSHYSLLAALQQAGLSASDVTIVDLEPQDIQAAWTRGDIDAAYVWMPVVGELAKTGKVLVTSKELAAQGKLTADLAVVRTQFATTYPKALRTWLVQQDRAVKLMRADPKAVAAAVGRQLNVTPAEAARQIDQLILLDGKEQEGPDYLGTPGHPGALAGNLHSAAEFLKGQNKLPEVPQLSVFQKALDTKDLHDAFSG